MPKVYITTIPNVAGQILLITPSKHFSIQFTKWPSMQLFQVYSDNAQQNANNVSQSRLTKRMWFHQCKSTKLIHQACISTSQVTKQPSMRFIPIPLSLNLLSLLLLSNCTNKFQFLLPPLDVQLHNRIARGSPRPSKSTLQIYFSIHHLITN